MAAQLNITLPEELVAFVRARVASGQYASESDVIQEGIEELIDRENPLPDWLRAEGAAAYDAWKAKPSEVSSVQEVRARFEARWTGNDSGE
jgi:putative addiction module CopG family antidote